jgi:hypothetical protein
MNGRNRPILLGLLGPSNTRLRRFAPGCQPNDQPNLVLLVGHRQFGQLGQAPHQTRRSAPVTKIGFEPQPINANRYCTV